MNQAILLPLQYLRGIAALMVVWHHGIYRLPNLSNYLPISFGAAGVAIFFVISGFVMVVTTVGKKVTPTDFFIRRLIRVIPLYWVMTIILSVILLVRSPSEFQGDVSPARIIQSLLFIPHFSLSQSGQIWPILVPGWTLNYEMFFYAMFAASLVVKYRLATVASFLLSFIAIGHLMGPFANPITQTYTNPLLLEFIAGMVICHLWISGQIKFSLFTSLFAILAGIMLLILRGYSWMEDYTLLIGSILLVCGCLNERILIWKNNFLLALGDASYSIYLTHVFTIPIIFWIWRYKLQLNNNDLSTSLLFMLIATVFSILIGSITYQKLEMPMLIWMKEFWNKKKNIPSSFERKHASY